MNLNERRDQTGEDGTIWFPHLDRNMSHTALGLGGEVGELQNMVKKYERGTITLAELRKLAPEEIVDSLVYLLKLAWQLEMDVEREYDKKREFNKARFEESTYHVRDNRLATMHQEVRNNGD